MATVGGNLLQRTRCAYFAEPSSACNKRVPGSGCSAITGEHHNHAILGASNRCVATNPSDMAVALAAFDAIVHYETLAGASAIPLSVFYLPVGDSPEKETALPPGALITAVELPASAVTPLSRYRKVRERASYAFANVSIAAALEVANGSVERARIALGGVASHPWLARVAEEILHGARDRRHVPRCCRRGTQRGEAAARQRPTKVTLARNLIVSTLTDLAGLPWGTNPGHPVEERRARPRR
jgi:xanthine dehydrogenase YagS FAD-binding subunit